MKYQKLKLSFKACELEPIINERMLLVHYQNLYQKYCEELNSIFEVYKEFKNYKIEVLLYNFNKLPAYIKLPILNNGGNYYNHTLFFENLTTNKYNECFLKKEFLEEIKKAFGSFQNMEYQLKKHLSQITSSGWVFLTLDYCYNINIRSLKEHENPLINQEIPLLAIDIWEHAYIQQYKDKKIFYIENIIKLINWETVQNRFLKADFSQYEITLPF